MNSLWNGAVGLVVRKTITLLIVLLLVLTVVFLFFRVGVGEIGYIERHMVPEQIALVKEKLHFDDNVLVQYVYFLADTLAGKGAFDLYSYTGNRPVADVIDDGLPRTLILFGGAILISLFLGLLAAHGLSRARSRGVKTIGSAAVFLAWIMPVVFVTIFFLLQVVWRFEINWAVNSPSYVPDGTWVGSFLHDVQMRIFPIIILTICSFGGFSLIALQGLKRANQAGSLSGQRHAMRGPSFFESVDSVMPNMKLNLAFVMTGVLIVEVLWNLYGLGHIIQVGVLNIDLASVEASVILVLLIVLISGFIMDLFFSLLALRHSRATPVTATQAVMVLAPERLPAEVAMPVSIDLSGEMRRFAAEYRKSIPGIVGGIMVVALAILALVGPIVGEPYLPYLGASYDESSAFSEFLEGAREPFLYMVAFLALSLIVGYLSALLTLPFGKLNYPVVLVAECFLVLPITGLFFMVLMVSGATGSILGIDSSIWMGVFFTVLVTWAPISLVVLKRGEAICNEYRNRFPAEKGLGRYKGIVTMGVGGTLPEAFASLKFVSVVGTLSYLAYEYSFGFSAGHTSWGSMISHSISYMRIFELDLSWILPLIGVVAMIIGFYLVLQSTQDILEKRFRAARSTQPSSP